MKQMKKILFLPLLQLRSGHHQVADALMDSIQKYSNSTICKKVDLVSYTNKTLEKLVTNCYLKWIRYAPETYHHAYKNVFSTPAKTDYFFRWHQSFFMNKMRQLLTEEAPDMVVCTQSFPSYLLSKIKRIERCNVPVINVYTDFFVNGIWGKEGIDAHFLPCREVKETLSSSIPAHKMIVTGIPVHEEILKSEKQENAIKRPRILIAGGNSGLGKILTLVQELSESSHYDYLVLCGKNKPLYEEIHSWNNERIQPLSYISSRKAMNKLYEQADAIITKPGGVTVSEALQKEVPIFIHSMLPGQEKINMNYLKKHHLVFELEEHTPLEQQLKNTLADEIKMGRWKQSITTYHEEIELKSPKGVVEIFDRMLEKRIQRRESIFS